MMLSALSSSTSVVSDSASTRPSTLCGSPSFSSRAPATVPRLSNGQVTTWPVASDVASSAPASMAASSTASGVPAASFEADLAHVLEHVRYGAGRREVAAVLRERCAHGAARAVAVVGQGFGDDGDAARRIAFVADGLIGFAVAADWPS